MNDSNEWNDWIEDAISRKLIKHYEYEEFRNIQKIGQNFFGDVYRANWKNSYNYLALKPFNFDNVTAKEIVNEVIIIYFSSLLSYIFLI